MKQTFRHVNTSLESTKKIGIRAVGVSIGPRHLDVIHAVVYPVVHLGNLQRRQVWEYQQTLTLLRHILVSLAVQNPQIVESKAKDKNTLQTKAYHWCRSPKAAQSQVALLPASSPRYQLNFRNKRSERSRSEWL